jgi:hypothetical protein
MEIQVRHGNPLPLPQQQQVENAEAAKACQMIAASLRCREKYQTYATKPAASLAVCCTKPNDATWVVRDTSLNS